MNNLNYIGCLLTMHQGKEPILIQHVIFYKKKIKNKYKNKTKNLAIFLKKSSKIISRF